MAAKTVTEDNKSVEEIVRPRPIPKKSRLTTEETDSPAPTERQRPSRSSSRSTPTSPRSSSRSTRSTSSAPTTRTRGRRSGY